jgi:hypothetical protein
MPLIIYLGKLAYDKYQARQAARRLALGLAPASEEKALVGNENVPAISNSNVGVSEGVGAGAPPSYDDIVVTGHGKGRTVLNEKEEELQDVVDEESFEVIVDGRGKATKM